MKIIKSAIFIILATIMLISTSCSQEKNDESGSDLYQILPSMIAEIPAESSFGGIDVKVDSVEFCGDFSALSLSVTNNSNAIISCDPWHVVELYENGKWVSCEKANNDFGTREKGVMSNSTVSVEYAIGQYNNLTTPGQYRFRTNFYSDPTGARGKIEAVIEFTVGLADVNVKINGYTYEEDIVHFDLTWINNSDSSVYLEERYTVQRMTEEGWVDCAEGELEFHEGLYAVKSKDSYERSYPVSDHFAIEPYGNYRMILEYHSGSGDSTKTSKITIEFTVPFIIE